MIFIIQLLKSNINYIYILRVNPLPFPYEKFLVLAWKSVRLQAIVPFREKIEHFKANIN
jgi:hypothetical protein